VHLFAEADPVLVGLNKLQDWLWLRLGAPLTEENAQLDPRRQRGSEED